MASRQRKSCSRPSSLNTASPFPRTHNLRLLIDLLTDAGHPLPSSLADLDVLTAYGTLFRYEDIPLETQFDRNAVLALIRELRLHVEKQISAR